MQEEDIEQMYRHVQTLHADDYGDDYSEWNHLQILNWILSLENGLFIQHKDVLSKSLSEERVKGSHLEDVDKEDIKSWGMKDFEHKQMLFKNIKILIKNDRYQGDTAYM